MFQLFFLNLHVFFTLIKELFETSKYAQKSRNAFKKKHTQGLLTVVCCPLTFKKKKINQILTMTQTLTPTQKKV